MGETSGIGGPREPTGSTSPIKPAETVSTGFTVTDVPDLEVAQRVSDATKNLVIQESKPAPDPQLKESLSHPLTTKYMALCEKCKLLIKGTPPNPNDPKDSNLAKLKHYNSEFIAVDKLINELDDIKKDDVKLKLFEKETNKEDIAKLIADLSQRRTSLSQTVKHYETLTKYQATKILSSIQKRYKTATTKEQIKPETMKIINNQAAIIKEVKDTLWEFERIENRDRRKEQQIKNEQRFERYQNPVTKEINKGEIKKTIELSKDLAGIPGALTPTEHVEALDLIDDLQFIYNNWKELKLSPTEYQTIKSLKADLKTKDTSYPV